MDLPPHIDPLTQIKRLPGVSHALALTDEGALVSGQYNMRLPPEWLDGLVQFVRSVNAALRASAESLSKSNETEYEPLSGWFYAGGDWGVCVTSAKHVRGARGAEAGPGQVAAFFLTERADLRTIFDTMIAKDFQSTEE